MSANTPNNERRSFARGPLKHAEQATEDRFEPYRRLRWLSTSTARRGDTMLFPHVKLGRLAVEHFLRQRTLPVHYTGVRGRRSREFAHSIFKRAFYPRCSARLSRSRARGLQELSSILAHFRAGLVRQ